MSGTETLWIENNYANNWWPNAKEILYFVEKYVNSCPTQVDDILCLDFLNGGTDEVNTVGTYLNIKEGYELLDIGSGLGGPARYISNKFNCNIIGIDLTAEEVKSANELNHKLNLNGKVQFYTAEVQFLPFSNKKFNGAYAIESLVHVASKNKALKEIIRVLKPGSLFVIADYIQYSQAPRIENLFPYGYHPWKPSNLDDLLKKNGFVNINFIDRSVELAKSYEMFANIFGDKKVNIQIIKETVAWWLQGVQLPSKKFERFIRCLYFLFTRNRASQQFLGNGRKQVLEFCLAQAEACRLGSVQYGLTVAKVPEERNCN